MSIELIIFDFDGTLVETEQQVLSIINGIRSPFGIKPVTLDEFRNRKPGIHIFGIQLIQFISPFLLKVVQRKQENNIKQMRMEPGLLNVIKKLFENGYHLAIVSSNSKENIYSYLHAHKLTALFQLIEVADSLDGKGQLIKMTALKNGYSLKNTVYVGDEVRDVEAAKNAGVRVVAVTWGYQAKEVFKSTEPDWLVDSPRQLLQIFVLEPWWKRLFMLK
jgi:phosphoglycolate phosphatase